jgi:predicted metal-dependent hydrolase
VWSAAAKRHYAEHKEAARELCHARLEHYNQHYKLTYNRVAIRNTRSRWGSCSSKKNLNFNYRILFLPPELRDYLIVHELCHLQEMNHAPQFWALVAQQAPDYKQSIKALRALEKDLFA